MVNSLIRTFLLISLLLVVNLSGCRDGQREIAAGYDKIPRDQMIRLMADVELTEAALKIKQVKLSRDSVKHFAAKCYDSLYQSYGVTPEQFSENLKYYQLDMEDFQAITDSVIINLTRRKDSISNLSKTADTAKIKTPDSPKVVAPDRPKVVAPDKVKKKISIK
ncbi:MAG: DUF4296 domain-containing protein [Lentimicrobium sp.]